MIIIRLEGPKASGKTRISVIIEKALKENGWNAEILSGYGFTRAGFEKHFKGIDKSVAIIDD
jgi:adenylylsulfate kinase-like enzyme